MHRANMIRSSLARALAAAAVTLLVAPAARAQEELETETPEIEVTYPPPAVRWSLTLAGLGTTALFYGAAIGTSYAFPDAPGATDLRVPVVGPWLAIAHNGCPASEPGCDDAEVVLRGVITALDGVLQAGGLAIALEGLFLPTQEAARRAPARAPARSPEQKPTAPPPAAPKSPSEPAAPKNLFWMPAPMTVGARGVGVGIVGRF